MPRFDVPGIVQGFQAKQFPERGELMKEFTKAIEHPSVKLLAAEIGAHAVDKNCNPIQLLGLGMVYGMTLGVLCEKYRRPNSDE